MTKMKHKPKPNAQDKLIALKLCQIRADNNVTRKELGDYLEISDQQIAKYEHGVNRISASMLFNIARFFDIDIKYFYGSVKWGSSPLYKPLRKLINQTIKALDKTTMSFQELKQQLEKAEQENKNE